MSYAYSVCPQCLGLMRDAVKNDKGGNAAAIAAIKPVSEFATKLTDVSNQAAQRRENKREKTGKYDRIKKDKAVKLYNKLKKEQKRGKLPPHLKTDEDIWNYVIEASGFY